MYAELALQALAEYKDVIKILDIGPGDGSQAQYLRDRGKNVTTFGPVGADVPGLWPRDADKVGAPFDAIWASHVFEHSGEPIPFLKACFEAIRPGGVLALTVPPEKPQLVAGHITTWNEARLIYALILTGWDCSQARCKRYGYNISIIVERSAAPLDSAALQLDCDPGPMARLRPYFPVCIQNLIEVSTVGHLPGIEKSWVKG